MNLRPSRRDDDELPDDLDALGAALERAARRQLARRRLLGRLAQGAAIVLIAGPLALLAVSFDDLSSSSRPIASQAPVAAVGPLIEGDASSSFFTAHIPDTPRPPVGNHPCLDGHDCTILPPVGTSSPAPEAKP